MPLQIWIFLIFSKFFLLVATPKTAKTINFTFVVLGVARREKIRERREACVFRNYIDQKKIRTCSGIHKKVGHFMKILQAEGHFDYLEEQYPFKNFSEARIDFKNSEEMHCHLW